MTERQTLIAWRRDPAAMNIADRVLAIAERVGPSGQRSGLETVSVSWKGVESQLVYIEESPLYSRETIVSLDSDVVLVLSMHRSETEMPSLTVHCTGNIGDAKYGGEPNAVSIAPAAKMKVALAEMKRQSELLGLKYSVSYEVTHHGPTVDLPIMFLEIGSSHRNWTDPKAGEAVARSALAATTTISDQADVHVGLGGPHYAPLFTSLSLREGYCFGHMVSWHRLPDMDEKMLKLLVERNVGLFRQVVLDWKGLRKGRDRVVDLLQKEKVPYRRS